MSEFTIGWYTFLVYAGGGKKLDRPERNGTIVLHDDGSLEIEPGDDYYGGSVTAVDARALALEILRLAPISRCEEAQPEPAVETESGPYPKCGPCLGPKARCDERS